MPGSSRFWHVTVTLSGPAQEPDSVRAALVRLGDQHAFLSRARYSGSQAEISYWEEADELADAAALALRVWQEHRRSAGLPRWDVVGLEILERGVAGANTDKRPPTGAGAVAPRPQPYGGGR